MASDRELSQRRVFYNASLLAVRTFLSILIGLYTSRVTLKVLGIENYGINVLVGGIVPIFMWFMGSVSNSISRFLTIEIGKGNEKNTRKMFSNAFWIAVGIAVALFFLLETVGLWVISNKLNIPSGRETATMWCYQLSIIGTLTAIITIPYKATITAHEHFKFYAYNDLASNIWLLANVIALPYIPGDKLIVYTLLVCITSLTLMFVLMFYAQHHFSEAKPTMKIDKKLLMPILSYSFWDLYGYGCLSAYSQVRVYFVNKFFGVRYNASVGTASAVERGVTGFTNVLSTAFTPQITKQYAQGKISEMQTLMVNSLRFNMLVIGLIAVPVMLNAETLIRLWLGIIPPSSPNILRCLLLSSFAGVFASFNTAIHSTGKIKVYSVVSGSFLLAFSAIIYVVYALTQNIVWGFFAFAVSQFLYKMISAYMAKKYINQLKLSLFYKKFIQIALVIMPISFVAYVFHRTLAPSLWQIIASSAFYVALFTPSSYFFLLSKDERQKLNSAVKSKLSFIFKNA